MADPSDSSKLKRLAVFGHPVQHSRSPLIHQQFARQCGHTIEYTAIDVDPGGFAQAIEQFRAGGALGCNITVPFKLEAYYLADNRSERAELAEACNTFKFEKDGRIFGDNTDGAGIVHDIVRNLNVGLKGKKILLMGAGGAVRGVLGPMLKYNPQLLVIVNRTVSKARDLAAAFADHGKLEGVGYDELRGKHFDIVINGTAASLKGEVPPLPETLFSRDALAYDMMYGDRPTPFMEWAQLHGAPQVVDGLGMLVEQAAESYFVWMNVRPQTQPVIAELRRRG